MELTVAERLILLAILPKEGDYTTLKIVSNLKQTLSFSEDEHKKLKFVAEGQSIRWESSAKQEKLIEIGDKAKEILASALKELDKSKKLQENQIPLYEKFLGGN